MAALVPTAVVKGLNDAGGWVDVQPAYPNLLSLQNQTAAIFKFSTPPVRPMSELRCMHAVLSSGRSTL